ncbi:LD-carboxypeptidase [Candidatus Daviesbacteria bacterium]|nr:LD-carboxypeptidase [Candidatus Daviesbacteria bacterium]
MNIRKPAKLNIGDTIGIVASSLPVLPSFKESYEKGKKVIQDLGFKIKEGNTIGKTRWWMTGTPKEVAEDINSMFADKNIKAIFAQTGGYSASSVLEYLDYEMIGENIKPYIGMSDVTNFHMAFLTKCKMVGFHMDDVTFGLGHPSAEGEEYLGQFQKEIFMKFLTRADPPGIVDALTEWEEWKKGKTEGHLIGGNLHLLTNLIGTPYFPSLKYWKGAILFWEEVGEPLYNIARFLTHLKYAGVLDKIAGMLIGKITYIKPPREKEVVVPDIKEMILEILNGYRFPIMSNLDFGHFTVNIPMPLGIKVSFDTSKSQLNFLESAVRTS